MSNYSQNDFKGEVNAIVRTYYFVTLDLRFSLHSVKFIQLKEDKLYDFINI